MEVMRAQHEDETATSQRPLAQDTYGTDPQLVTKGPAPPYGDEDATEDVSITRCVTSCLSQAVAPPGYTMVDVCPPLETSYQQQSLIGKVILYGWEDSARTGWFVGRVARNRVTARDKREVPTASHVVRYTARQTNGKIDGLVACELSARTYGANQWWVLLQKATR